MLQLLTPITPHHIPRPTQASPSPALQIHAVQGFLVQVMRLVAAGEVPQVRGVVEGVLGLVVRGYEGAWGVLLLLLIACVFICHYKVKV